MRLEFKLNYKFCLSRDVRTRATTANVETLPAQEERWASFVERENVKGRLSLSGRRRSRRFYCDRRHC